MFNFFFEPDTVTVAPSKLWITSPGSSSASGAAGTSGSGCHSSTSSSISRLESCDSGSSRESDAIIDVSS